MDVLDYGHEFITLAQNPGYKITGIYNLFWKGILSPFNLSSAGGKIS